MQQTLTPILFYIIQDDYRVCLGNGILERGGKIPCPVNSSGHFTDEVFDFKDMHVKVRFVLKLHKHE